MVALPDEFKALAEHQYGLVSVHQASEWLDRPAIRQLRRQSVLTTHVRGVLQVGGTPGSWEQGAMGACLAYGDPVAVWRLAAARLLGWEEIGQPPVGVVVPPSRSGRQCGVTTHRAPLPADDIVRRFAIPVTAPARTLVDVSDLLAPAQLERLYDHLMRHDGLSAADVLARLPGRAAAEQHARHALWRLSILRAGRSRAGESIWEDRLAQWLIDAALPEPERQHEVILGEARYRLDLAYPRFKVAVEFEGWEWHKTRGQFDRDRARQSELALAGWLVVLVTAAHSPQAAVDRVRRALHARGWPSQPL